MASWQASWSGARRWWVEDTPRPVRWTVYICLPLGLLLLIAGVYGDSQQWWEGYSFATNLVSSLTSLLFGVPTALIVLSHLSLAQAEAANRRAVQKRARLSARAFHEAVMGGLFGDTELEAERLISDALDGNRDLGRHIPDSGNTEQELTSDELHSCRAKASERDRLMAQVLRSSGGDLSAWLNSIVLRWTSLERDLRPRLEEIGLPWLEPHVDREVRAAVRAIEERNTGRPFRKLADDFRWRQPLTWGSVRERCSEDIDTTKHLFRALRRVVLWLPTFDDLGT
ncbi:hypothetical protein [Streptomyces sp. LN500]|uniref:hypothetical protein n=1 Tax=Streptomyces sp. LN500 TaxID=3112978 RepID=UPI003714FAF9